MQLEQAEGVFGTVRVRTGRSPRRRIAAVLGVRCATNRIGTTTYCSAGASRAYLGEYAYFLGGAENYYGKNKNTNTHDDSEIWCCCCCTAALTVLPFWKLGPAGCGVDRGVARPAPEGVCMFEAPSG